jgi:hypothetical protein
MLARVPDDHMNSPHFADQQRLGAVVELLLLFPKESNIADRVAFRKPDKASARRNLGTGQPNVPHQRREIVLWIIGIMRSRRAGG